jgi:sirohydrochlorin cobaltochelatase
MRDLTAQLANWLSNGGREVGEVAIASVAAGFELCHRDELSRADLRVSCGANAAREIANYDDAGSFRPLKTAPNLRHGWKLCVGDLGELRRALDYFYPAMLGVWCSHTRGELAPVPLRATLGRQTGMYRITQKLTEDQAQTLIGGFCQSASGCLKHLLWPIAPELPIRTLPAEKLRASAAIPALPLLCHEACNLLVAQARAVVKKMTNDE